APPPTTSQAATWKRAAPACSAHATTLTRQRRRLSRRSLRHKQGKKPRATHAARQRARHNTSPTDPAATTPRRPQAAPQAAPRAAPQAAPRAAPQTSPPLLPAPVSELGAGEAPGGQGVPASPAAARGRRPHDSERARLVT